MKKTILLSAIEQKYRATTQEYIEKNTFLTTDSVINLSLNLFIEYKVAETFSADEDENDMLLLQYGVQDWGDEKGEHFNFDITRQFILTESEEFYQLSFSLIFDPTDFRQCESYNSWSTGFKNIDDWAANTRSTLGYHLSKMKNYRYYCISLRPV